MSPGHTLVVKRTIAARREDLFDAWIDPGRLARWWGPNGVSCSHAEIDARQGGAYRIANRFPDGRVVWISGVYEIIDRPALLIFSWRIDGQENQEERVRVSFTTVNGGAATEITVLHERIATLAERESHEAGWNGCLDGLELEIAG